MSGDIVWFADGLKNAQVTNGNVFEQTLGNRQPCLTCKSIPGLFATAGYYEEFIIMNFNRHYLLRKHLLNVEKARKLWCMKCELQERTAIHIICKCGILEDCRQRHFGSKRVIPKHITQNISKGVVQRATTPITLTKLRKITSYFYIIRNTPPHLSVFKNISCCENNYTSSHTPRHIPCTTMFQCFIQSIQYASLSITSHSFLTRSRFLIAQIFLNYPISIAFYLFVIILKYHS